MPKFVIERDIPGARKLSPQDLHAVAQRSCGVLSRMGPQIPWVQSYVTDDEVYCIYVAQSEEARARARAPGWLSRQPGIAGDFRHRPDDGPVKRRGLRGAAAVGAVAPL